MSANTSSALPTSSLNYPNHSQAPSAFANSYQANRRPFSSSHSSSLYPNSFVPLPSKDSLPVTNSLSPASSSSAPSSGPMSASTLPLSASSVSSQSSSQNPPSGALASHSGNAWSSGLRAVDVVAKVAMKPAAVSSSSFSSSSRVSSSVISSSAVLSSSSSTSVYRPPGGTSYPSSSSSSSSSSGATKDVFEKDDKALIEAGMKSLLALEADSDSWGFASPEEPQAPSEHHSPQVVLNDDATASEFDNSGQRQQQQQKPSSNAWQSRFDVGGNAAPGVGSGPGVSELFMQSGSAGGGGNGAGVFQPTAKITILKRPQTQPQPPQPPPSSVHSIAESAVQDAAIGSHSHPQQLSSRVASAERAAAPHPAVAPPAPASSRRTSSSEHSQYHEDGRVHQHDAWKPHQGYHPFSASGTGVSSWRAQALVQNQSHSSGHSHSHQPVHAHQQQHPPVASSFHHIQPVAQHQHQHQQPQPQPQPQQEHQEQQQRQAQAQSQQQHLQRPEQFASSHSLDTVNHGHSMYPYDSQVRHANFQPSAYHHSQQHHSHMNAPMQGVHEYGAQHQQQQRQPQGHPQPAVLHHGSHSAYRPIATSSQHYHSSAYPHLREEERIASQQSANSMNVASAPRSGHASMASSHLVHERGGPKSADPRVRKPIHNDYDYSESDDSAVLFSHHSLSSLLSDKEEEALRSEISFGRSVPQADPKADSSANTALFSSAFPNKFFMQDLSFSMLFSQSSYPSASGTTTSAPVPQATASSSPVSTVPVSGVSGTATAAGSTSAVSSVSASQKNSLGTSQHPNFAGASKEYSRTADQSKASGPSSRQGKHSNRFGGRSEHGQQNDVTEHPGTAPLPHPSRRQQVRENVPPNDSRPYWSGKQQLENHAADAPSSTTDTTEPRRMDRPSSGRSRHEGSARYPKDQSSSSAGAKSDVSSSPPAISIPPPLNPTPVPMGMTVPGNTDLPVAHSATLSKPPSEHRQKPRQSGNSRKAETSSDNPRSHRAGERGRKGDASQAPPVIPGSLPSEPSPDSGNEGSAATATSVNESKPSRNTMQIDRTTKHREPKQKKFSATNRSNGPDVVVVPVPAPEVDGGAPRLPRQKASKPGQTHRRGGNENRKADTPTVSAAPLDIAPVPLPLNTGPVTQETSKPENRQKSRNLSSAQDLRSNRQPASDVAAADSAGLGEDVRVGSAERGRGAGLRGRGRGRDRGRGRGGRPSGPELPLD
eukprot:ANDGO_07978.mRNA.1 hypothetical protein